MTTDLSGTHDAFIRVDLGDLGTLVVRDDGDPDNCTRARIKTDSGDERVLGSHILEWRNNKGDGAVLEAVEGTGAHPDEENAPRNAAQSGTSSTTATPRGFFVCSDCMRTWPARRNQTYGENGPDVCHECDEDDA